MISGLLDELSSRNHVRVVKFAASKPRFGPARLRRVLDEVSEGRAVGVASLVFADSVRALSGREPVWLAEACRLAGGELVGVTPNLRTNVGTDFMAGQLSGTSTSTADWIGLSNNTGTPGVGDTAASLPWSTAQAADAAASGTTGEWTGLGLARALATYAHTTSAASYTLTKTWTASGASTATRMCGLFGGTTKNTAQSAAATNILVLENTFTATTLATNDQLQLVWTINI